MGRERIETIRQEIINHLESGPMTAREISQAAGVMEKDVHHHLASIEKSVKQRNQKLHVAPYHCLGCGFQFKSRKTFKRPGKCPVCKEGRIATAHYFIV